MLLAKNYFIIYAKWTLLLCTYFPSLSLATSKCHDSDGRNEVDWYERHNLVECILNYFVHSFMRAELTKAILYKAPAQAQGKLLTAGAGAANWAANAAAVTAAVGHSFAKALEHVIAANVDNKFISYNNHPPDVPKVQTKSNSKGNTDAAAWIVHTVPGFPKARTGYLFPPAEVQKGHLLICLTIKEDQIDTIAMTLRIATPLIYYNDIPDAQMDSRPNLKKLANGESRLTPPLTVTQDTTTTGAQIWTTRDKFLKSDCKTFGRNLKLVTSPISVDGHASSLENDVSQWIVSEPGNKFCVVDKPYHKSQAKEPAMAVCIDDATIFGHFNRIAQNVENCA
ncbi:Plancitoxin-1 [Trichinella murrelli]|uniref:Plancitoxin-1 n=1 Tax=Trichinella murrelli TaxID=144512 RepID=A0A0V0TDI8_9BILA|nr:Plancitoxin-1 [Trichinella murrelli]